MVIPKNKLNWLVNAGLLFGFPLTFAIDSTGLSLHQWLGVLLAALAVLHMALHWGWCRAVTARLNRPLPWKTRGCWLLDAALLAGFAVILVTGLAISTWRDAVPVAYDLWLDWHIAASYGSLGLAVVKVALKGILGRQASREAPQPKGVPGPAVALADAAGRHPAGAMRLISRRQALLLVGTAGLAVPLAAKVFGIDDRLFARTGSPGLPPAVKQALSPKSRAATGAAAPGPPVPAGEGMNPGPAGKAGTIEPATWNVPLVAGSNQAGVPLTTAVAAGIADQCPKRKQCTYPGRCRHYVDNNRNGLCDLGESL